MIRQPDRPNATSIYPVYVPDTTTPGVLVSELLGGDGPYRDYADQWVRVGGLHATLAQHTVTIQSGLHTAA